MFEIPFQLLEPVWLVWPFPKSWCKEMAFLIYSQSVEGELNLLSNLGVNEGVRLDVL
jgi:hypothetical protein